MEHVSWLALTCASVIIFVINLLFLLLISIRPSSEADLKGWLKKAGYSELLQFKWRHCYLLDVPVFKFLLMELSNVTLASLLTVLPSTIDMSGQTSEPYFLACYCWVFATLWHEATPIIWALRGDLSTHDYSVASSSSLHRWRKRSIALSLWRFDALNLLMLASLLLAFVSLTLLFVSKRVLIVQELFAFSLMGLWFGTGLQVAALLPEIGPLVKMGQTMVRDVLFWLVLLSVAVVGFSAASFTLHKSFDHVPSTFSHDDELEECVTLVRNKHESLFFNTRHLFRIALGARSKRTTTAKREAFVCSLSFQMMLTTASPPSGPLICSRLCHRR